MSKFQVALLAVFGFFILVAVLVFSLYKGSSSSEGTVIIWGSIPSNALNSLINSASFTNQGMSIRYTEKEASRLAGDFTEALAQGSGPDLIIISQEDLWQSKEKLVPIPYGSISRRDFQDAFAQGAETFLLPSGIYALPVAVDPLILYYNRDLLSAAGIAKPLSFWDEIYTQAGKLTKKDAAGNIIQSTIALGETKNIANFKEIFSLLLLQAGSSITRTFGGEAISLDSALLENPGLPVPPGESALDFYTQFANPSKSFYSWNRSLTDAQTNFASGDAAYYVGFASELSAVKKKSPTLNVAVSAVPQSRVAGRTLTFGRVYGIAISRGTRNSEMALAAATTLVSGENAAALAKNLGLPPVRRDLLSARPTDSNGPTFYDAALQMRGWLDPDPAGTRAVFGEAIEAVTSGRSRTLEALSNASRALDDLSHK